MPTPSGMPVPVPTGITGLDQVLKGGVPTNSLLLIEGQPGTGKTTMALQFLLRGAGDGKTCLLASNAETPEQVAEVAASHGWSLDGIHVMEWAEPAAGENGADSEYTLFPEAEVEIGETLRHLFAEVERLRPDLLVIDTISALRVLAPSPGHYRRQLRRIRDFLASHACTTMILDDALESEKEARNQTIADGIIELRQVEFQYGADRRRLRVRKMRRATYIGGAHDFTIETGGLVVYPRLVAQEYGESAAVAPLTSGIAELDALTGGGLTRGSSTLIMGPAGSGKSTVATLYAMNAANQGDRSSIVLFDESEQSHNARSSGLGLDVVAAVESGKLDLIDLDPAQLSAGQIAHLLVRRVEEEGVGLVVIDTLNGYLQSAMEEPTVLLHLRELISYLGRRRVVTLMTLTQHGILGPEMATPIDLSFLADNVFLLRYFEARGRIRQALSVVKKRSGPHERSIRELRMKPGSVSVSEPLQEFTGLLTGTPQYSGSLEPGGS